MSGAAWETVVADAVARIGAGELEKVVLARDLVATADADIDVRWPLRELADDYEMCWTFHVDGLFGATPEMLVRRERGLVTSRVLAGTIRRTGDDEHDLALAGQLARSSKDLEEHEYAVRSVAESLAPYCSSMNVPEVPFVLHLPNVMHLATDVAGVVHDSDGASVLELAAALHPSAAVGGTPTKVAVELIAEIEGMDRGRYAGPVGWMDAAGDGEFGIALRSAEIDGQPGAAVRRLRHRRRLRPRGRARRGAGEVPAGAGRADRLAPLARASPSAQGSMRSSLVRVWAFVGPGGCSSRDTLSTWRSRTASLICSRLLRSRSETSSSIRGSPSISISTRRVVSLTWCTTTSYPGRRADQPGGRVVAHLLRDQRTSVVVVLHQRGGDVLGVVARLASTSATSSSTATVIGRLIRSTNH